MANNTRFTKSVAKDRHKRLQVATKAKRLLKNALLESLKHPFVSGPGKNILKRWPWLWEKCKQKLFFQDSDYEGFTVFKCVDTLIHFSNAPLVDQRGIGRVTRELHRALSQEFETVSTDELNLDEYKHVFFYSSIHWCPNDPPRPVVVMIHDVIPLLFPEQFPRPIIQDWRERLTRIARQSDHVITISKSNIKHLQEHLGIEGPLVSVVYNGVSQLHPALDCNVSLPAAQFLTYLGSYDRHKNIEIILQALQSPELATIHLVLIGDNQGSSSLVRRFGLSDRVHFLGRQDDAALAYVLTRSIALVFPSLYEGFGLPPLEAALLKVPVICSNRPSMNELVDAGFIFCEPTRPEDWVKAISTVATVGVSDLTLENVADTIRQRYNWKNAAYELKQTLTKVARHNPDDIGF